MNIIYHLPYKLKYDCSKSKFIEIDSDLALKYLKLIYKDFDAFQDKFLVKIEKISDLKSLTEMIAAGFENATAITATEIDIITNKKIRKRANKELSRQNRTSNFERFKSHISKLKAFMNQDSCDDLRSGVEAQNKCELFVSDYVNTSGKVLQISKIKEYTIIETCEKIDFKLNNIKKLLLKSNVKFLNCSKSNLKEIELNNELQYLNLNKNQLTEIKLTGELIHLNISKNNLKELVCNAKLENLIISRNQLKTIQLNNNLKELNCSKNEISHLDLNPNLLLLNAKENPIKRIKLNKAVKKIKLSYPDQEAFIIDNSINNQQVKIHFYINLKSKTMSTTVMHKGILIRINTEKNTIEHSKNSGFSWVIRCSLTNKGTAISITDLGEELYLETTNGFYTSKKEGVTWILKKHK